MKTVIALVLALAIVWTPLDADASRKGRRRVREAVAAYTGSGIGSAHVQVGTGRSCEVSMNLGCAGWDLLPGERYVRADIDDDVATTTSGVILEFADGTYSTETRFCGAQEEPVPLRPDTTSVVVFIESGPCQDMTPAFGSSGVIHVTFSNRP